MSTIMVLFFCLFDEAIECMVAGWDLTETFLWQSWYLLADFNVVLASDYSFLAQDLPVIYLLFVVMFNLCHAC